jgi:hypothetical protein
MNTSPSPFSSSLLFTIQIITAAEAAGLVASADSGMRVVGER